MPFIRCERIQLLRLKVPLAETAFLHGCNVYYVSGIYMQRALLHPGVLLHAALGK